MNCNNHIPDDTRIAQLAFDLFASISKSGKPIKGKEWTVLTCVAQINNQTDNIEIVALGTGTSAKIKNLYSNFSLNLELILVILFTRN